MIYAFLGIVLQAFPFLITGVLLSSFIGLFVPRRFIERRFPKSVPAGMLFAIAGGFCLPVCDCVSIPVFRSLVKKGIPLTCAIVFMTASPVINPVVMLSTYYAFGGNLRIVCARVLLGIVCSILTGVSFTIRTPKAPLLSAEHFGGCECAHCSNSDENKNSMFIRFLEHARREFFGVAPYLIVGAALSAVFQRFGGKLPLAADNAGAALSLFIMMSFAFLLSLCSSSDAVIGRTFIPQFSVGAVMGFLVFGPMMDIKNLCMLSSGFTKSFTVRLFISCFAVCYLVLLVCMLCGPEALL